MADPSGFDLSLLLAQLAVVLGVSRLAGAAARPLGQPMVVAEIIAGFALGPTLLGRLAPEWMEGLFPSHSLPALDVVSQVGLLLFMFVVGLEFDPGLLKGRGKVALQAGLGGIIIPFALGGAFAWYHYAELAPHGVSLLAFVLFMGADMSVTAFPVLARITAEKGILRTPLGGITMACAAFADVAAWCLVAFAIAAASSGGLGGAIWTTASAAVFFALMILGVRPFLDRLARRFLREDRITAGGFALVLLLLLASAMIAEWVGVHAMLGAFLFGAIVPRRGDLVEVLTHRIEELVVVLFLPVFFAVTGLRTDLGSALTGGMGLTTVMILALSMGGKLLGTAIPARLSGMAMRESLTMGFLMNTRGLMELVILNIGRELGVLPDSLYASLVVVGLFNTLLTSPAVAALQPAERLLSADKRGPASIVLPDAAFRILVSCARTESVPGLVRVGAALARGGEAWAASLSPVGEQDELHPVAALEEAASRTAGMLGEALAASGVPARPLTFPSAEPGRDIALLARAHQVNAVLVGMHTPLLGTAVFGGPLREMAGRLEADLWMLLDRGRSGTRALVVRGGAHDPAVVRVENRLRLAGFRVQVLAESDGMVGLERGAAEVDLVVVGVGRPWAPGMSAFELRDSPIFEIVTCDLLFVKAREVGGGARREEEVPPNEANVDSGPGTGT